jgi:hypothetical protein
MREEGRGQRRTRTRSGAYGQVKGHGQGPERRKRVGSRFVCRDMEEKENKNSLLVILF